MSAHASAEDQLTAAVDEWTRDRSAMSLKANRELDRYLTQD